MKVRVDKGQLDIIIENLKQSNELNSCGEEIENITNNIKSTNINLMGLTSNCDRTLYFGTSLTKCHCINSAKALEFISNAIDSIGKTAISVDTVVMLSFQRGINNKVLTNDGDGTGGMDRAGYSALLGCTSVDDIMAVLRAGGCDLNTAMNYMAAMGMSISDAERVIFDYSQFADGLPESPSDLAEWRNEVLQAYKNKITENSEYRESIHSTNESTVLNVDGTPKCTVEKQPDGSLKVNWTNHGKKEQSITIQKLSYPEGATAEEKAAVDKINNAMENVFLGGDITSNNMSDNFDVLDAFATYTYSQGSDFAQNHGASDCSGLVGFMLSQITGDASCETIYTGDLVWGELSDRIEGLNNYSYSNGVDTPVRVGDAVSYRFGDNGHTEMVVAVYEDGSYDTINLGYSPGVNTNHYGPGEWGMWTDITRYDGITY